MRQTVRSAGLLSLFLLNLTNLSAEPLVRGFFIEKLPEKVMSKKLDSGKGLVLAHVFNSGKETISSGNYQVGVEIENAGKKRTFVLKPREQIVAGALKTFRMAVPVSGIEKTTAQFRVFSKIDGKTTWSDKYSFLQGPHTDGDKVITTLYTEAPPEHSSLLPVREVPFENEKTAQKAAALEKAAKAVTTTKTVVAVARVENNKKATKQLHETKTSRVAPDKEVKAKAIKETGKTKNQLVVASTVKPEPTQEAPVQRTREIDPSEFKKLRTIDEELVIYVIKDGDTLKSIAEKYYGASSKERTIADLNFIEKPSAIRVGEEIIVDVKPLGKESSAKTAGKTDKSAKGGKA